MEDIKLEDYLSQDDLDLVKKTLDHFFQDPDYATGEEQGLTFEELSFGDPLPFEIVLRDWNTSLNNGKGGRELNNGDCYRIYKIIHEEGGISDDQ